MTSETEPVKIFSARTRIGFRLDYFFSFRPMFTIQQTLPGRSFERQSCLGDRREHGFGPGLIIALQLEPPLRLSWALIFRLNKTDKT